MRMNLSSIRLQKGLSFAGLSLSFTLSFWSGPNISAGKCWKRVVLSGEQKQGRGALKFDNRLPNPVRQPYRTVWSFFLMKFAIELYPLMLMVLGKVEQRSKKRVSLLKGAERIWLLGCWRTWKTYLNIHSNAAKLDHWWAVVWVVGK